MMGCFVLRSDPAACGTILHTARERRYKPYVRKVKHEIHIVQLQLLLTGIIPY